ncbi:TPA: polyamine ABC transporter substrate-binding protein, partial [Burkholderia territorii]
MQLRTFRRNIATAAMMSIAGIATFGAMHARAAGELNIYNWSDYIAPDTIPNFQKQTGLHVRYDNYDSDDTLQA